MRHYIFKLVPDEIDDEHLLDDRYAWLCENCIVGRGPDDDITFIQPYGSLKVVVRNAEIVSMLKLKWGLTPLGHFEVPDGV